MAELGFPRLLDDQPETDAAQLWSGLELFAERLARLIPGLPGGHPVLITGPWGSGKTTLLRAICARIEQASAAPPVWFEAWRHDSVELLLPALVRCVWNQSPNKEAKRNALRVAMKTASVIACRAARVAATAAGGKDLVDALGSLKDWTEELTAMDDGVGPPKVDVAEALHISFSTMIASGWPESAKDRRRGPIIFVDDLDRCDPTEVVAFIEQLRQIVVRSDTLPCRFVLAVDHELLLRAISSKFTALGSYDSNRYLEKVFPFAFALPVPDAEQVTMLLNKLWARVAFEGVAGQPELDRLWREALALAFSDANFSNPRLMKRCINRFMLVQHFELGAVPRPTAADNQVLAKWLAATERWPTLRRLVLRPNAQLETLAERIFNGAPNALGTDLEALIHEPGVAGWLKQDMNMGKSHAQLEAFRHAESRLQRWGL